jgi:hypothetical protein
MGMKMETPVFNILILWLMTGLLYLMLYYDILRKAVEKISSSGKKGLPNL